MAARATRRPMEMKRQRSRANDGSTECDDPQEQLFLCSAAVRPIISASES